MEAISFQRDMLDWLLRWKLSPFRDSCWSGCFGGSYILSERHVGQVVQAKTISFQRDMLDRLLKWKLCPFRDACLTGC